MMFPLQCSTVQCKVYEQSNAQYYYTKGELSLRVDKSFTVFRGAFRGVGWGWGAPFSKSNLKTGIFFTYNYILLKEDPSIKKEGEEDLYIKKEGKKDSPLRMKGRKICPFRRKERKIFH